MFNVVYAFMARFLKAFWDDLQNQRERWILWLPVPLGMGIIFYFTRTAEPPLYVGGAALTLAGALYRWKFLVPWLALFLFLLGFAAGQFRTWSVAAPVLHKKTYPVTVEGRIVEVDPLPKAYRIVIDGIRVVGGKIWQNPLPERVRVKLKNSDPARPRAGDTIRVKAILLPLSGPVLPGAFDFQRHAFFKKLGGTGYALGNMETVTPGREGFFFEKLRGYIRERVSEDVKNKEHAGLITAFLIGESNGISEKAWEICRRSGIAHLIAISGSHFVLVAGFAFFLLRAALAAVPAIALRWPIKKISAGAAILVCIFYMLLIGAPIPAQRAVLSASVIMLAVMLDRDPFTLRLAAFSALVILLIEPESLLGASFQLSFAAIVALIAAYESSAGWWRRQLQGESFIRRCRVYLLGCFLSSLVAGLATAPFALYHFSEVPLLAGFVANMIAVPVSSFVTFPVGLMACLLMPFGLEKGPLWVMEKSLDLIMAVAEEVAGWSWSVHHTDAWPAALLGLMALGGLWVTFWRGKVRWLGFAPIAVATMLIPFTPRPDILIAENGKLFAARGPDGKLWLSSLRREKFVRNEWLEREGGRGYAAWPEGGSAENGLLSCDAFACLYRDKGYVVSFVKMPEALVEDCRIADMVVSAEVLAARELCPENVVSIDKWDIRRNGAHAVYLGKDGSIQVGSVKGFRGERPWTAGRS